MIGEAVIPCTLNGFPLDLTRFTDEQMRALTVHSYLSTPGGDVDDENADPLEVVLEGVIGGLTPHRNKAALFSLIESTPPPLVLVHPSGDAMPIAVRNHRYIFEAGKNKYTFELRVVRDTPTIAQAITSPIILNISAVEFPPALNADFSALSAILALWSAINSVRNSIVTVLNQMAALGYLADLITDVAASEVGSYGDMIADVTGSLIGGLEGVSEFPDDVAAAIEAANEEIKLQLCWTLDASLPRYREIERGEAAFYAGRFVTGHFADGGPTDKEYADLAAYTGLQAAIAGALAEHIGSALQAAEADERLTAPMAERAVSVAHKQLVRAHRLARQVLPGGKTAAACAGLTADLIRLYRSLKIRSGMVQVVALEREPLFLLMDRYGVPPARFAEVARANDLTDLLVVPVGTKVWLPRVGNMEYAA